MSLITVSNIDYYTYTSLNHHIFLHFSLQPMIFNLTKYTLRFIQFTVLRCPTFSKLTTLLLNEWCLAADFGALSIILQRSPILEKLTLLLNEVYNCRSLKFECWAF
jgi:hypothetical protein